MENYDIFHININDKNKQSGELSLTGVKQNMRTWFKFLVEKNYIQAVNMINEQRKKNQNITFRVIKVDDVKMQGSEKESEQIKDRINLTVITPMKFNNNDLQKYKKIITWLTIPANQEKTIVINVEIY